MRSQGEEQIQVEGLHLLLVRPFSGQQWAEITLLTTSGWNSLGKWLEPSATSGPVLSKGPLCSPGILIRGLGPSGNIESRVRRRKARYAGSMRYMLVSHAPKIHSRRWADVDHTLTAPVGLPTLPVWVSQCRQALIPQRSIKTLSNNFILNGAYDFSCSSAFSRKFQNIK